MTPPQQRFESLLLPVREGLYRFALQLTGDPVRADDLLSMAVVAGLRSIGQLEADPAFRTWMSRIVYRTHLNEQKRLGRGEGRGQSLDNVVDLAGTGPGPDDQLSRARLGRRIAEALDGLPEAQAQAVWLVDGQGLKYREAAEVLGIPRGTAATLVARGRRTLRGRLREDAREQGVVR